MCGICGIYSIDNSQSADLGLLRKMTILVRHRGPDDEGYLLWGTGNSATHFSGSDTIPELKKLYPELAENHSAYLAMGFRRLAIIDPSPQGHQPMSDAETGLAIVFNGEIYNYRELRAELQQLGYEFRSTSDTEVILRSYQHWGEDCVNRFNGIWAFVLWDSRQRKLFCSRDRFGVKPFYYCSFGGYFFFGSELKQLLAASDSQTLNLNMLWRSMKINSLQVYGAETYWNEIQALEGGHNLIINNGSISVKRYHRLKPETFSSCRLSLDDATAEYNRLFRRAVDWQLRSDVEVGACLSGGLDSSAIVCCATKLTKTPLQSFSSWFGELPELDERRWIEEVVNQSACRPSFVSPTATDALSWINDATWFNDLPVGAGFAAQYAVMQLAQSKGVKVLLDGQGSDELTAGYKHAHYRFLADLLLGFDAVKLINEFAAYFRILNPQEKMQSFAKVLLTATLPEKALYGFEFRHLRFDPFNRDFRWQAASSLQEDRLARVEKTRGGRLSNFLYNEIYTTSLPTLLHWEDRMSMAVSVESRVPFLDHELVEFAFTLPSSFKIKNATRKYIHRLAMKPLVPQAIYQRKDKAIFGSPIHKLWLRREFRSSVEEMLSSQQFRQRGIWNLPQIRSQWNRYLQGDNSQAEMLFNIFALETWFRVFS